MENTTEVATTTAQTWLDQFDEAYTSLKKEAASFYDKGTAAAGGRARKLLQDIRSLAKTGREDIQSTRLSRKAPKA